MPDSAISQVPNNIESSEVELPAEGEPSASTTEEKIITPKASPKPSPRIRPVNSSMDEVKSCESEVEKPSEAVSEESPLTSELRISSPDPVTVPSLDTKPSEDDDEPAVEQPSSMPERLIDDSPIRSAVPQVPSDDSALDVTESPQEEDFPISIDDNVSTSPTLSEKPYDPHVDEKPVKDERPTTLPTEESLETAISEKRPVSPLLETPSSPLAVKTTQSLSVRYVCMLVNALHNFVHACTLTQYHIAGCFRGGKFREFHEFLQVHRNIYYS